MSSGIMIREGKKKDAEVIAEFSRQTFYETFAADNSKEDMEQFMHDRFNKELLMAEVEAPGNTFLLAYEGPTLVGYARLRENNSPQPLKDRQTLEIARIYAATSAIGKGIGSKLMQACLDIAKQRRKSIVWLGVWEKNHRAIEFYRKWGFEKFSDHEFILGKDVQNDWLMKKEL